METANPVPSMTTKKKSKGRYKLSESEAVLAANAAKRLRAPVIVKGWPGATGDFLRRMNSHKDSPLRGLIDFGNNTQLPIEATAFVRSVLCVLTGLANTAGGDTATVLLPRTDAALKVTGRLAWAEAYAQLVAAVFGMEKNIGRVRAMAMRALAEVAHQKYTEAGRPIFPRTCALLRRINWDTCVPKHTLQYYPMMVEKIERRWRK